MDKKHTQFQATLEAVLFMYGTPVKISRLAEIIGLTEDAIKELATNLESSYRDREAGLHVLILEDQLQLTTNSAQSEVISAFTKAELEGELSQAALEVLAIIAYRGPIAKPDIEAIRGVNCSFTLRNLLLRGLAQQKPHPTDKRTQLYSIAPKFMRTLGLSSASELPHFAELAGDKRIDAILYSDQLEDSKSTINEE